MVQIAIHPSLGYTLFALENTLKAGAMVEILLANGHEVKANRVNKKKR